MYDTSKLRGRIIEKYGSLGNFAEVVNCSRSFLSLYMNGKKKLDQPRIDKWMDALSIERTDVYKYFFTKQANKN